ncbi:M23 family metallopeptidase [Nonomuraea guangzhouensis]|uniref:M23 family metallopeptidase n=1 Tax=Nonomuraea guangzhouensis TaxID=1291555 RepID=A0ABW4G9E7_9ACTN|nr:M23 family metallopeptidase [Nonomuraea guangzhouensis]
MKLSGLAVAGDTLLFSLGTASSPRRTRGFGNLVKIDLGGRYATSYAHLNSFSVNAAPVTAAAAGSIVYNSPSEHCGS